MFVRSDFRLERSYLSVRIVLLIPRGMGQHCFFRICLNKGNCRRIEDRSVGHRSPRVPLMFWPRVLKRLDRFEKRCDDVDSGHFCVNVSVQRTGRHGPEKGELGPTKIHSLAI